MRQPEKLSELSGLFFFLYSEGDRPKKFEIFFQKINYKKSRGIRQPEKLSELSGLIFSHFLRAIDQKMRNFYSK